MHLEVRHLIDSVPIKEVSPSGATEAEQLAQHRLTTREYWRSQPLACIKENLNMANLKDLKEKPDHFMTVEEVADLLSVPVNRLYHWKIKGCGPPSFQPVPRSIIRYSSKSVLLWIMEHTSM